jgi:CHAD domain-containing protein
LFSRQMDIPPFASEHLTRLLNRLAFQINATAARRDPDSIHDLRVAIRRFSQGLVVFKTSFASKKPKKIRRVLKEALASAGRVRDCDIAAQLLAKHKTPGLGPLSLKLAARRKAAVAELLVILKHWKARRLSAKWRRDLEAARVPEPARLPALEDLARGILPRDARKFLACGARAARPRAAAEELHLFRIAAKKFRYSLELFTAWYPVAAPAWIERLKEVQQLLGSVNDCRTTRLLVSGFGVYPKLDRALKRRQDRKMAGFRRYWGKEFGGRSAIRPLVAALSRPGPARKPAGRATAPRSSAAAGA